MIAILEKYEHNIDFHQIVDFVEASHIRRNLKLNDEAGISSLPDAELFENLALMGYNILPHQKFTFQKGFNEFSSNIAIAVVGSESEQDKENIIKTSALPHDSPPRVTSLATDEGSMQQQLNELMDLCTRLQRQHTEMATKITAQDLEIASLKARIKMLEDKYEGGVEPSGEDATIKGRSLETGEEACVERSTERGKVAIVSVPTGSGLVPTASPIFTTISVVTPYSRRKGNEKMIESDTPKKKLQEQIDMLIDGLDRNNETIAKYLQEYEQFAAYLFIEENIDMINELVKYQDHYAKVLKYQSQQRKPLSKKQQREFYMSVLKSHPGWKIKHFKGMSLEEIREKFILVWKQIEDFVPMASKEEGERFKGKGLRLEQGSAKKIKTSKEVSKEDLKAMIQLVPVEEVYIEALQVKHPIIKWEIHTEGQRNYWKIIKLGGHTAVYQFFVDMLKHFDREDLTQLWTLVKEFLSIRQATSDKKKELWVELKRLYEPDVEDQLWTHTQALMHDPVEWRLYDTCGVHHVLSRD
nr:hypothetical protein [Tanacetum cinerariifolium]